jgi:hypothetical protein
VVGVSDAKVDLVRNGKAARSPGHRLVVRGRADSISEGGKLS